MCGRVLNWSGPTWQATQADDIGLSDKPSADPPRVSLTMRLACEIQSLARRMQRRENKDELRQRVARVTLEMQKLEDNVQDLRDVFSELQNQYAESSGCCFPFSYIMLQDMVLDVSDLAARLQHKWYGATDQSNDRKVARGGVRRLVETCRAFSANRQALNRLEVILESLQGFKYEELERLLKERQAALSQQKVIFGQLQDLLKQLQELHTQSQQTWLCPRYLMLKRGVHSALAAFSSVAGLSEQSPSPGPSSLAHPEPRSPQHSGSRT